MQIFGWTTHDYLHTEFASTGLTMAGDSQRIAAANPQNKIAFIKTGLVHKARFPARDAAERELFAVFEGYYNCQRALGCIAPEKPGEEPFKSGVRAIAGRPVGQ